VLIVVTWHDFVAKTNSRFEKKMGKSDTLADLKIPTGEFRRFLKEEFVLDDHQKGILGHEVKEDIPVYSIFSIIF
jgi:hypothetical protein